MFPDQNTPELWSLLLFWPYIFPNIRYQPQHNWFPWDVNIYRSVRGSAVRSPLTRQSACMSFLQFKVKKNWKEMKGGLVNHVHTFLCTNLLTNLIPPVFSYFSSVHAIHNCWTRGRLDLLMPFVRTTYSLNTLRYYGPRLWNIIDAHIKFQLSLDRFKCLFKKHLSPIIRLSSSLVNPSQFRTIIFIRVCFGNYHLSVQVVLRLCLVRLCFTCPSRTVYC